MMREFHHIAGEERRIASRGSLEQRRRFGLDVAREEDAADDRTATRELDPRHERAVVRRPRPTARSRPDEVPAQITDHDRVAFLHRADGNTESFERRKQLGDRHRPFPRLEEGPVHDHLADTDRSRHLGHRTEVIEVRMAQDHQIDAPSATLEPWNENAGTDRATARRTRIEECGRRTRLDEMHRTVADGDRRDPRERHIAVGSRHRWRPGRMEASRYGETEACPSPPSPAQDERTRESRQQHDRRQWTDRSERYRSAESLETSLDEGDLHLGGRPEKRTAPGDEWRPRDSDDRLRVRDRERRRRQWRTHQCQQCTERLHRSEVEENEGSAHEECRERGRDGRAGLFTEDPHEWRGSMSVLIAGKPAEPARPQRFREVPKGEDATEAQLEAGVSGERWITREQHDRRAREHRIPVPVAPCGGTGRTDDRHDRRSHRARRRRHQDERTQGGEPDRDGMHAPVVGREPREGAHDPAENGEVEPRDGEDVGETHGSERSLDHSISLLALSEDECDEHRTDRGEVAIGNTRKQRLAQP